MPVRPPPFRPNGWKPAQNRRPEVNEPYYGTQDWKKLRQYVYKRDGYRCTEPGCPTPNRGQGGRLIAGHIIDRRKGGPDHPSNVRTFCPTCDGKWTGKRQRLALG